MTMTTGKRMRHRRKELGLSVDGIAVQLDVSPATIYRYESGDIEKIPGDILPPLAKALQTTPSYLLGWEESDESKRGIPTGFVPMPETVRVPIVGSIACGQPILAEENIEDYADVPKDRQVDFCLLCVGDSMKEAGICDGDIVYIRSQPDVENGEIAAVRIGSEATLKRVYKFDDHITLVAENRAYPPMTYTLGGQEEIQIEGKVVGYQHWF